MEDDLLDTAQAQRELGLKTPSAISKMVKRGDLEPAHKHRGKRGPFLFRRTDVERLKAERAS